MRKKRQASTYTREYPPDPEPIPIQELSESEILAQLNAIQEAAKNQAQDLQEELARRKTEAQDKEKARLDALGLFVEKHANELLPFAPTHDQNEHGMNVEGTRDEHLLWDVVETRCVRCALLRAAQGGFDDFELVLSVKPRDKPRSAEKVYEW